LHRGLHDPQQEESPVVRSRPIALIPTLSTVAVATIAILAFGLWFAMSTTPVRAADQAVAIEDFLFSPGDLTIEVGDTVTWTNLDSFSHTATSTSGPASFDSGNLATGDTFSFTFDTAGMYEYFCEIHPNMIGSITVTAAAATAAPSASAPSSSAPASSAPAASSMPDTGADAGVGASGTWPPSFFLALVLLAGLGMLVTFRTRRS